MKLKISTLFHWLYATLMFLPILMFIPSCIYYGFNHEAQAQEEIDEQPIYYQSNEVVDSSDLVLTNVYTWSDNFITDVSNAGKVILTIVKTDFLTDRFNITATYDSAVLLINSQGIAFLDIRNSGSYISSINVANQVFDFVLASYNTTNIELGISHIVKCNALYVKEYVDVTYTLSIIDSINYAWERTWNLPVFSWTQNSFVAAPFSYITGLFGLSSDNSINYVFTYFVSISICWLVFDLLMYVPNLAHRWLDRSAIE